MKKIIGILIVCIMMIVTSSCFRVNFTFPSEYKNSVWESNFNNFSITMRVDENGETFSTIKYKENERKYYVIFKVECANFYLVDENNNYILDDGKTISIDDYQNIIENVGAILVAEKFIVTKTKNEKMNCWIKNGELYHIFPYFEYEDADEKIYFTLEKTSKDSSN